MDRREVLKKLAIGGVAVAGGTGLLAAPAISKPPADRGGGKPGPDPTPTSGPTPTPTPTPAPGDPIGVPLTTDSPAFVEFQTYKGGRGAKARFRVAADGVTPMYHGWHELAGGTENDVMEYELNFIDYVDQAVPVAGDATYPAYLDVKAGFGGFRPQTGSFRFYYWHGPSNNPIDGVYENATYYDVTVFVEDGSFPTGPAFPDGPFSAKRLITPPTSADFQAPSQ